MNRIFTTVAVQSAIAAVIIVAAPFAGAAEASSEPLVATPTTTVADRAAVRQGAIEARNATLGQAINPEAQSDAPAFHSTLTRSQVRAEATETVRLGLTGGYENRAEPTTEQLAQIRRAGERAGSNDVVAVRR